MDVFLTGIPKTVIIGLFLIIIMNVVSAEYIEEHKTRHQRHQPQSNQEQTRKNVEEFRIAMRKIKHKLRNTKRFFDHDRRVLNETKDFRDGMFKWLPSVNFVDIHFRNYRMSRKNGRSAVERKFTFLMPKLYRVLREYDIIFNLMKNVQLNFSSTTFTAYVITRRGLLNNTIEKLQSTINEISLNMAALNIPLPPFDENRLKLDDLRVNEIGASQCLKNDYVAFRGYGNLLNNWNHEFRCPINKINDKKCESFHTKMKEKLTKKLKNAQKKTQIF